MFRHLRFLVVGSLCGLALSCGTTPPVQTKVVTFGAPIDQTGDFADPNLKSAYTLANTTFNTALKEAAYKNLSITLEFGDTKGAADIGLTVAKSLVADKGAKALMLDQGGLTQAVAKTNYLLDGGVALEVPAICGACGSDDINNPAYTNANDPELEGANRNTKKWNFRGQSSTKLQAKVLARMVQAASGVTTAIKVSAISQNDAFGRSTMSEFTKQLKMINAGSSVETLFFNVRVASDKIDWPEFYRRIVDDKTDTTDPANCPTTTGLGAGLCNSTGQVTDEVPDMHVFIGAPGYTSAGANARKTGDYKVGNSLKAFTAAGARASSTLQVLGSSANDLIEGTSHILLETGDGDVLKTDFVALTGSNPTYRVSTFYDIYMVFALATAIAVKDLADPSMVTPAQIRDAVTKTSDPTGVRITTGKDEMVKALKAIAEGKAINYQGGSGPMDFDADQNVRNKVAHWVVQNGEFVDQETFDCVASDDCTKL